MKKTVLFILTLIFVLLCSGCDTFKDAADSFKTGKSESEQHSHNHKDDVDEEETSVNLNYKVVEDSDKNESTTSLNTTKVFDTTKKTEKTTKKKEQENEAQYPYTNVNDGDATVYEWPEEGLAAEFPELKSGTMKKPFISDSTFSVYFANVDPVEFDKYINNLKKQGFTVDDTTDLYLYVATNDKVRVEFFYDTSKLGNNTLSLIATYINK